MSVRVNIIINVGSDPGVVNIAWKKFVEEHGVETVKKTAFKITRISQLVWSNGSERL